MDLALSIGDSTAYAKEITERSWISGLEMTRNFQGKETHSRTLPVQLDLLPLAPFPRSSRPQNTNPIDHGQIDMNQTPPTSSTDYSRAPMSETEGDRVSCDEGESTGGGEGSTRKKLRLSKEQSAYLEESFKEHNTLNPKQKLALAKRLKLRPRQVEVWFQNRRARTKLKQTEVDCEYLKRCCETLTEENRRLHMELQELRALKRFSVEKPLHLVFPAASLTVCPSCERFSSPDNGRKTTGKRFLPFAQDTSAAS
ncbi:homeobox-leucine zipper protein HOX11 [Amborella trichopoda]|uniref:Homeobox domain-containing protein n=1 Tax=Amborella trichopoda TaxID=13333 RepID=U5D2H5_AMBTC|nr:homeobox-leucine zipper protein HOX11 [Amborella trichopoda]ERN15597.1 hypothetical protein AMTR_s00048p00162580 [Amborella trichopoda]|eukprot:XP_006854130.1 homeobox-leucine zipper protein HOX11 [Amborella trichopoda]